jgi:8-oxo-dGTP diphosphatase
LKGYWSLPGGAVETGEQLNEALRREVLEETGLEVDPRAVVEIFERIIRDSEGKVEYHFVVIDYLCKATGGDLGPSGDAARVEWIRRRDLGQYKITEGTLEVIERAFERRSTLKL